MKKYLKISLFGIIISSLLIYSCTTELEEEAFIEKTENSIVFEDQSLKTNISPNYYDNHFYLIEQIGNNDERKKIVLEVEKSGASLNLLNIKDVKKFYFNHSDIIMYSVAYKNSKNKVIIYKYDSVYQIILAENSYIKDKEVKQFKFITQNNELFYSLQLNGENKIGNYIIKDNSKMNSFKKEINILNQQKKELNNLMSKTNSEEEEACTDKETWSDCMDCTVSECSSSWVCGISFALLPVEMAAGFAISCLIL